MKILRLLRLFLGMACCAYALALPAAYAAGNSSAPAANAGGMITNDVFFKDTAGTPIWSQGGGIFEFGGIYYWYGVKYAGAVTYYANPTPAGVTTARFSAITCYSSTDLVHWHFENNVLTTDSPGMGRSGWVGRMGVAYNPQSKKYVLLAQGGGGELFATCDTPTGNFTFDHVQRAIPNLANDATGDQTVFVDTDGKAYLICSSKNGRSHLYVCPLRSSDYLSVDPAVQVFEGPGREGNCLFKYRGRYYFCSSDLHGWNASHCYVIEAAKILGPYSAEYVMPGTEADFCHVTQTGFFVTVQGTAATTVLFCGDRWADFAGNGLGYNQWCPLSFNGTKPFFNSVSQFNLDTAAGTWTVGAANNYILNPSFEADRVAQSRLAGWTATPASPAAARGGPIANSHDARTGQWSLRQYAATAYTASMSQTISGLPAGNYTLSVWAKSSGGQNSAQIFARGFGGPDAASSVANRLDDWTRITLPHLTITSGQCTLGVRSDANPGDWVEVDDFALTKD